MRLGGTCSESIYSTLGNATQIRQVLHSPPAIFHRDIRWPNIIRRLDDPSCWFLIDWEDAEEFPTKGVNAVSFDRKNHSPRVFADGHGPEVDMWGVGELILTCQALGISSELKSIGSLLQSDDADMSAEEALNKIRTYRSPVV